MVQQPFLGRSGRRGCWVPVAYLTFTFAFAAAASLAQKPPEATHGPSVASRTPEFDAPASEFAGSEQCRACHKDEAVQYEKTSHFKVVVHGKDYIHGCEACHGPAKAHADSIQAAHGDDAAIAKALKEHPIFSFKGLNAKQVSEQCLGCHQNSLENSNYSRSIHLSNGVGCLDCHSAHYATEPNNLLVNKQPLLCYGCHTAQKAEFARPYRHRVDVGLISCSDCHNPHGSTTQRQLRKSAGGFAVCNDCHTEKMGPFVYEHVPVKIEGCGSCHTPHGSTNPRLLRVSQVNLLCLQCHSPTAHNPVPEAPSFHNQTTQFQACTLCHTQTHGSNLDRFFFK
jgi:DmsE family decaheme c-type cytochrome